MPSTEIFGVPLQDILGSIGTAITVIGAGAAFLSWRQSQLRKSDINVWSLSAIDALQTLTLLMSWDSKNVAYSDIQEGMLDQAVKLSVLIEQGRLYFKNIEHINNHGAHKRPAYRGLRPRILDCLLIGLEAAERWQTADANARRCLFEAVLDAEKEFVSIAQREVGRNRTVSEEARTPGKGSPLDQAIESRERS